jgi:hypothetical protein
MPACAFLSRRGPSQYFRFISVSSSVSTELVVGNTVGTQPLPARRILFHEARRHESCRALRWSIALLRSRGLLFRRHKHSSPAGNLGISQNQRMRTDPASLRCRPSNNHLADVGLTDRIRTHETGFSGSVERAAREIESLKCRAGVPNSNQFSMT